MKRLITALLMIMYFPAMAGEIHFFKGSFEEALEKAKLEDKYVFVDVYTQWCAPCKVLAKKLFYRDDVAEIYNQHFISFKLDAEDEGMNGPALAEKYQVESFPTLLFLDSDGNLLDTRGIIGVKPFKIMPSILAAKKK